MSCAIPSDQVDGGQTELQISSWQKKMEEYQRQADISLAGEQLRLRLHNSKLIKDRCHHTFTYPNCFVAKETVDWLIVHKEASDRETAIAIMQKLFESNILHHVCDKHSVFKDAKLFYRFRNDDGTIIPSRHMKLVARSKRVYEMMISQEDSVLQLHEQGSERYPRTFQSSELLDWLVKNGQVAKREDGERLCHGMLEYGIIQHVNGHRSFSDSDLLFQFCINFRRRRKLIEVLDSTPSMDHNKESPDSPFCLRKLSNELPQGSFVCENEPIQTPLTSNRNLRIGLGSGVRSYYPIKPMSPPSVLKKPVTTEELLAPDAPYILKTLNVVGDDVGWGFVARGTGPCHIQALDPGGPAATAGMKIRQFIKTVNGINCLNLPYQTIYKHVVAGPRILIIEVLEPIE